MSDAIFISYRRDDSEGEAGRLYDDLIRVFGADAVFMDVSDIHPGKDFRQAIDDSVAKCGVLLAIIGQAWTTIKDESGARRLDQPNDFVRLEIASALARQIPVVPVLVHEARMPHPEQLPDNLKDLAYRNGVELSHARWNSDVQLLTSALAKYIGDPASSSTLRANAPVPIAAPPLPASDTQPVRRSKAPLLGAAAAALAVLLGVGTFLAVRHPHANSALRTAAAPATLPTGGAVIPASSQVAASSSPLVGSWTNPTPKQNNALAKLNVSANGQQLTLHAWGLCQPADCDWGEQTATFDGQKATANWTFLKEKRGEERGRIASVTLQPSGNGLQVTVLNIHPKRAATQEQFKFVRAQ